MKKKLLRNLCTALALVLVLFTAPAVHAVDAAAADGTAQPTIEQQVRDFAKSIYQSGADDVAASALAMHGISGGGKKLSVGKSHALTATLFNSELLQAALTEGCTEAIRAMHMLDLKELSNMYCSLGWYDGNTTYSYLMLCDAAGNAYENWDTQLSDNKTHNSPLNEYDASLNWIAGSASFHMRIDRTKRTADSATYKVTCTVYDRFDFNTSANSFFKNLISGIGALLFREFDWEATVSFNLTVPYDCSHSSAAYRWTYDAQNHTLISDASGDWKKNEATGYVFSRADGLVIYYHELEETIRLRHDRPWVLEYDVSSPGTVVLSALKYSSLSFPGIWQASVNYLKAVCREPVMISQETAQKYGLAQREHVRWHYYGIDFKPLVSLDYYKTYTMRLENEIHADGSNMIYLTVVNTNTGEVCMEHIPMDDYVQWDSWSNISTLISRTDNWFSGRDLNINFIGNQSYSFNPGRFELRIWENGEDGEPVSYYRDKVVKPTCTAKGYTQHTCSLCGYSYNTDYVNTLPHKFGQYVSDKNATCTEDGTKTAKCSSCSATDTVADVGSAAGHSFDHGSCTVCGEKDPDYASGDFTGDELVTNEDVTYLLWHTLFPADFPVDGGADLTGDGRVTNEDVTYLLWHTLFPGDFPL